MNRSLINTDEKNLIPYLDKKYVNKVKNVGNKHYAHILWLDNQKISKGGQKSYHLHNWDAKSPNTYKVLKWSVNPI